MSSKAFTHTTSAGKKVEACSLFEIVPIFSVCGFFLCFGGHPCGLRACSSNRGTGSMIKPESPCANGGSPGCLARTLTFWRKKKKQPTNGGLPRTHMALVDPQTRTKKNTHAHQDPPFHLFISSIFANVLTCYHSIPVQICSFATFHLPLLTSYYPLPFHKALC